MWPFKRKPYREVSDGAWGCLVSEHKIDVDTISRDMRCVEKRGVLDGRVPVTFLRIFRLSEVEKKGVIVSGWETFDTYPDLIVFEGYLTDWNEARLTKKATVL